MFVTFSKTSVLRVRCSENWWIMQRYLIEAIQPYTFFEFNHVDSLFRSEDTEKKEYYWHGLRCHVFYGKFGKLDFYV